MPIDRREGRLNKGIRWGNFTFRIPLYHTRCEWPDLMQGLIVTASTAMALVPLLQAAFGLSFYEAVACSMIHMMLISAGPIIFGDPFAPGWITPALPITLAYVLGNYIDPVERFQVMTALSLDFAAIMLFFGITGLGSKFVHGLPVALKSGIILGASIASFKRVFHDDIDTFMERPIATSVAIVICLVFAFSRPLADLARKKRWIKRLCNLGLLPGFVVAGLVGAAVGEIEFNVSWGILIPPVDSLWQKVSPFYIGWPSLEMFVESLPLALIVYTIAFGDFITGEEIIKDAQPSRLDDPVDVDVSRTHLSATIRNVLMAVSAPFFPTQGVLWTGVHVIIIQRWRQGKMYMGSLFGGISSFYLLGLPIIFFLLPVVTLLAPMMNIALSISLVLTGFACAFIALSMPKTSEQRGVALLAGVMLAVLEPWLGLLMAVIANQLIVGSEPSVAVNAKLTDEVNTVVG